MTAVPLAVLDLPLQVLILDDGGQTRPAYRSPAELAGRYGLNEELAARLRAIDVITDAVIER